jgi:hypothetical protein
MIMRCSTSQPTALRRLMCIVFGCLQVKDAFGLPLQSSANTWWTMDLDAAYQGPNLNQVSGGLQLQVCAVRIELWRLAGSTASRSRLIAECGVFEQVC